MLQKTKITFVVPEQLQKELRRKIINDNYGMRGKSRWVAEAIKNFLNEKNYTEMVNLGDEMHGFEKAESISIDLQVKNLLDEAILTVRKQFPLLEGVQSRIVRSSIVQRLLRS